MSTDSQLDKQKMTSIDGAENSNTNPETLALDHISQLVERLKSKRDRLKEQLDETEKQFDSATVTFDLLSKGRTQINLPTLDLHGKTQVDALIAIAEANGNRLVVRNARRLLMRAGLIKNEKNASGIIFTAITRSNRFEREVPGVYRLIPPKAEWKDAISLMAG